MAKIVQRRPVPEGKRPPQGTGIPNKAPSPVVKRIVKPKGK
jgi:hypothetical protein